MLKIVNAALKAKAWTFEAETKAVCPDAKAIKFGLKAKTCPRGLHHCNIMLNTSDGIRPTNSTLCECRYTKHSRIKHHAHVTVTVAYTQTLHRHNARYIYIRRFTTIFTQ